jgi:hypothetical protein
MCNNTLARALKPKQISWHREWIRAEHALSINPKSIFEEKKTVPFLAYLSNFMLSSRFIASFISLVFQAIHLARALKCWH